MGKVVNMVATTEVLDTLKSIGLNLYERKIFVALLAKGVATAAEVSEIAGVPRSRSYDVLQSLADKGFVLVQPSKPIKYVALAPEEAFERTKEIMRKRYEETVERINKLSDSSILRELDTIYREGLNMVQPTEITGTLKGKDVINRQLRSIFKGAKRNINIITTEKGLGELHSNHFRVLKKISKSGVKLRILSSAVQNSVANNMREIADVRSMKSSVGRFCIVDSDHVILSLTDDSKVHATQDVALWANSQHAARDIMQPYFETLWKGAR